MVHGNDCSVSCLYGMGDGCELTRNEILQRLRNRRLALGKCSSSSCRVIRFCRVNRKREQANEDRRELRLHRRLPLLVRPEYIRALLRRDAAMIAFVPGEFVGWLVTHEIDEQGMVSQRLFRWSAGFSRRPTVKLRTRRQRVSVLNRLER